MFCRQRGALAGPVFCFYLLLTAACNRAPRTPAAQSRRVVLRCENLSQDASQDWIGRAVAEMLSAELTTPGSEPVTSLAALRATMGAWGNRPAAAPGISTEREAALAAGATRLITCQFSGSDGKLRITAVEEDTTTAKTIRRARAEGSLFAATDAVARHFTAQPRPYGTKSEAALRAYAEALDASDPDAARQHFAHAVAADPNFGPAYQEWAQAEASRHDRAGVERVLALAEARGNALPAYDRARIQLDAAQLRGDGAAQARALAALAKTGPADASVYRRLAETALAGRRYRDAVNYYRQAVALAPADVQILNALGYAEAYLGDYEAAMAALREYQRLQPNEANPLDSQGDVNFYFNRYGEAEKLYLAGQAKAPNFLGGAELLKAAQARLATGDVPGANAIYSRYVADLQARHDPSVAYREAGWRHLTGRRKEAMAMLENAAKAADAQMAPVFQAQLAIWQLESGNRDQAARWAGQAMAAAANGRVPALAAIASLLVQPETAPAEWQQRAKRMFGAAGGDRMAGCALLFQRQFAAAVPWLRHAYEESSPNNEEGLAVLLAWALIESGTWDGVIALIGPSPVPPTAGIDPLAALYFPRLFYLRGRLAEHQGKRDKALENYRLFLKLAGTDGDVWGDEDRARQALGSGGK